MLCPSCGTDVKEGTRFCRSCGADVSSVADGAAQPTSPISGAFFVGPDSEPDKYRLVHQVGSGGEAQLWKAELSVAGTNEPVAIKILRTERLVDIERWKARWAEQAEVLRFIRHPGVVGVREHFEGAAIHHSGERVSGTALYLVMNWVEGTPLSEWVPLHRTDADHFAALRYLGQVGDVLDWLHSGSATPSGRELIHADVTPGNVIIPTDGQAVLVDFGLTRLAGSSATGIEGTRGYMAPEVQTQGQYSPASDRYSFGALTYFVLTGAHPPATPEGIQTGLYAVPALAAQDGLVDHLMQMFHPQPERRPPAGDWIRFFRVSGTTITAGASNIPGITAMTAQTEVIRTSQRPKSKVPMALVGLLTAVAVVAVVAFATRGGGKEDPGDQVIASAVPTMPPATEVAATPTPAPPVVESEAPGDAFGGSSFDDEGSAGLSPNPFLEDKETVGDSDDPDTGIQKVSGEVFAHSVYAELGCTEQQTFEYDMSKHYRELTATIGINDESSAKARVLFEVFVDEVKKVAETVGLRESIPITVPVTDGLRLRIEVTETVDDGWCKPESTAVWGDAQLHS